MNNDKLGTKPHYQLLDGLRGVAAIIVVFFHLTDSTIWPLIHTVPVWKLIVVMLIGYTIIPIPLSMDIRGWQEMHPLNSVGWSLFFEYIANLLYALGLRKLSNKALALFVVVAGAVLLHFAVTNA